MIEKTKKKKKMRKEKIKEVKNVKEILFIQIALRSDLVKKKLFTF